MDELTVLRSTEDRALQSALQTYRDQKRISVGKLAGQTTYLIDTRLAQGSYGLYIKILNSKANSFTEYRTSGIAAGTIIWQSRGWDTSYLGREKISTYNYVSKHTHHELLIIPLKNPSGYYDGWIYFTRWLPK